MNGYQLEQTCGNALEAFAVLSVLENSLDVYFNGDLENPTRINGGQNQTFNRWIRTMRVVSTSGTAHPVLVEYDVSTSSSRIFTSKTKTCIVMTRKGTPPVVSFKTANPTHPPDVANKDYVDNIIPIIPVPPVYTAFGSFEKDVMIQGYIPNGVNTTFRFSPLGGLLYKQGDVGNEFPQTPIRSVIEFRSFRVFLNSLSQNETI